MDVCCGWLGLVVAGGLGVVPVRKDQLVDRLGSMGPVCLVVAMNDGGGKYRVICVRHLHADDLLVGVLAAVHHQLHAPFLLAVLARL